ncbi:MAG: hypothetical protein LKG90_09955, partial [Lachnospiraceae bacterium]|nr:hypothetical protein [Lachnospiraceae bacterium]MCI1366838.1 hypothetical protein [Lachnospiraceae bacterium]MCI1391726.1 hypothetical protein [Lachnospiraceae bacterium]MCI1422585.1 hypothetical protein [Lachnospiraceae bacterium]MCI1443902.1 hypothetical protein [Lachnospiraceae bacterium]
FALGLVGSPNPASFRFHLTMDTLAFSYVLPTTGRTPDLHRLENVRRRAHHREKRRHIFHVPAFFPIPFLPIDKK